MDKGLLYKVKFLGVNRKSNRYLLLPIFLLSILIISCSTRETLIKVDEEEVLRKRIEEFWRFQIDGFTEKAYQYLVPAYREKYSILQYAARFRLVKYLDAEVMKIEIDGDKAECLVNVTYKMYMKMIMGKELKRIERERWVRIKGVWYYVPEGFELN